ncbi:MAG: glycosyltransferase [Chloroflexia bacterium]
MDILFLTPYVPTPIRTRPYNLLKALAGRGHRIALFCVAQGEGWLARSPAPDESAALEELRALGITVRAVVLPRLHSLLNCLRAFPTPLPLQAVYSWSPSLARLLHNALTTPPDAPGPAPHALLHIEHLRAAHYGLRLQKQTRLSIPMVWDSVDCISYLFEQSARASRSAFGRLVTRFELARTRRYEARLLRAFDRTLVTSPADAAALAALPSPPASRPGPCALSPEPFILPNGVDLAYFHPDNLPRRPEVVFSGKMSYHANITAALYLAHEVMPRVWERRPDVQLTIAGSRPPRSVRALAGERVTVTGYVEDIRPFLRRAAVAVAPMPYGAGIQNKVLEAMACATPVVATPQAVAALRAHPGTHLRVGETSDELAAHILDLLEHPEAAEALGRAGRAYVEQHHDWQSAARQLENLYEEEIARKGLGSEEG